MLVDFHCHSTASDGSLTPAELVQRAIDRGVALLAITDHDTVDAYADLQAETLPISLIHGIELSCSWSGVNIHVLGLGLEGGHPLMAQATQQQKEARASRAKEIARRLDKKGFPGSYEAVLDMAGERAVGRPDFARFLVEQGHVDSVNTAFDRYLGNGKIGDVKAVWPSLDEIVAWIRGAGGVAVLAHPLQYKMTNAKLRRLLGAFQDCGGEGLEVFNGRPPDNELRYLRDLCREFGLLASAGSDFHHPNNWLDLGCEHTVIGDCEPLWQRWLAGQGT